MPVEMTAEHLKELGFVLNEAEGILQRFRWSIKDESVRVSLWVVTTHPVIFELTRDLLPCMDACVCWYHDHHALSCLRVRQAMHHMEQYTVPIWLMATIFPRVTTRHASRVMRFYDANGFERERLTGDLTQNLTHIVKRYGC